MSTRPPLRPLVAASAVSALAVAALAGCSSEPTDGTTRIVWAQPTPESMAYFPYVIADELGYFAEEGLTVDLAPASEDLSTAVLVASGSADIAAANAAEIFFATRTDADLSVVYDATSKSPEGIVVPEESDAESMTDLEGATIGIVSDEERALVATALEVVGLTLDDVSLVTVGGSGQVMATELEAGRIDAIAGSVLDFSAIEAVGHPLRDVTPEEIAGVPSGALIVSSDLDPEVVQGFLRAFARAHAYGLANSDEAIEILRERIPEEWENEEVALSLWEIGLDLWQPRDGEAYGALVEQVWADALDRMLQSGELTEDVDLATLLDDSYVASANDAID